MFKAEEGWLYLALSWSYFLNVIAQPLLLEKLLDSAKNINDKLVAYVVAYSSCTWNYLFELFSKVCGRWRDT